MDGMSEDEKWPDMLGVSISDFSKKVIEPAIEELAIKQMARSLRMARFHAHKNAVHKYARRMALEGMTEDEARHHYTETMANFDQIIELAAEDPARLDAAEADMADGFALPDDAQ
jgi:hypothetical protein